MPLSILATVVGPILGGVIASLVAVYVWERFRQPRVTILTVPKGAEEPSIQTLENDATRGFYHLRARNRGATAAYHCKIDMTFYTTEGGLQFRISGKWDHGPQPLLYQWIPAANDDWSNLRRIENPHDFLIPFAEVTDIFPRRFASFGLLVKYEGDADCYAFSAWGYMNPGLGHRIPAWRLSPGEHYVRVRLIYSGTAIKEWFRIANRGIRVQDVDVVKLKRRPSAVAEADEEE